MRFQKQQEKGNDMEVGIDSFAAMFSGDSSRSISDTDSLSQLLDRIEHADHAGLDVFGIGEHHRKDFLDSAPTLILAAAAARTKRIRLTSAVTVLSAADPVRVDCTQAVINYFLPLPPLPPALPCLRRTTSPLYRIPLPLYGSGLRSLRISAAV